MGVNCICFYSSDNENTTQVSLLRILYRHFTFEGLFKNNNSRLKKFFRQDKKIELAFAATKKSLELQII